MERDMGKDERDRGKDEGRWQRRRERWERMIWWENVQVFMRRLRKGTIKWYKYLAGDISLQWVSFMISLSSGHITSLYTCTPPIYGMTMAVYITMTTYSLINLISRIINERTLDHLLSLNNLSAYSAATPHCPLKLWGRRGQYGDQCGMFSRILLTHTQ